MERPGLTFSGWRDRHGRNYLAPGLQLEAPVHPFSLIPTGQTGQKFDSGGDQCA